MYWKSQPVGLESKAFEPEPTPSNTEKPPWEETWIIQLKN